jgi:hypothetical protein
LYISTYTAWPVLLEKAWAKVAGTYDTALNTRTVSDLLNYLLDYDLETTSIADTYTTDLSLYTVLDELLTNDTLFFIQTNTEASNLGLRPSYYYVVTKV